MDSKELEKVLVEYSRWNRAKCVPWWNTEDCMFPNEFLKQEEIDAVREGVEACTAEELSAGAGPTGLTMFHLLVWCGLCECAESALKKGVDVNLPGTGECEGVTPLMAACYRGNERMVRMLLENGGDSGLSDKRGRNALHYLACCRIHGDLSNSHDGQHRSMGQRRSIAGLLSGDVNARDEEGMSPFEALFKDREGNLSWALAGEYIAKGAQVCGLDSEGASFLMRAVDSNFFTAACALMDAAPELVNLPDKEGTTPLHLAARYKLELSMALLDRKADKNAPDKNGKTPKDLALESGDDGFKQLFTSGRLKLNVLSNKTSNAFAGDRGNRDQLAKALYLTGKLIREVDPDDDEEMGMIEGILYNALVNDEECRALEMMVKGGLDLTAPIHRGGSVECIRDKCFTGNGGVKVIRKFMELGVDINEAVIKGRTPARIVAAQQKRMMWNHKKDDYFEKAARFFSRESMEQVDDEGTTAVHQAARQGHTDMLRVMLEKGVDVNIAQDAPAEAGNTPLHEACARGNVETAELLMKSGADDAILNVKGETAAHLLMKKRVYNGDMKPEERMAILEALEHVDVPGAGGRTPLMLMLQQREIYNKEELLSVLLGKDVDVDRRDDAGNTALIIAMDHQGRRGVAKELVRAGADVNAENRNGDTALQLALRWGDQESAIYLIKKGADYNHANNAGVTPAQLAAEKGYDTVLELMTDIQ